MTDRVPIPSPPVYAGQLGAAVRAPAWPLVIGIMAIIWGAITILSTGLGLLFTLLMRQADGGTAPEGAVMSLMQDTTWFAFSTVSGLGAAVLLIVAGAGMVRRRYWSVPAMKVWSWYSVVMAVIGTAVAVVMLDEMVAASMPQGQATPISPGAMQAVMIGGLVVGFAIAMAPPVFLLIWLSRASVRENILTWR